MAGMNLSGATFDLNQQELVLWGLLISFLGFISPRNALTTAPESRLLEGKTSQQAPNDTF